MPSYRACILGLVLILAAVASADADVYTVDDPADAVDANPADGLCLTAGGMCSLRAAVQQANAHAGADEVVLPIGHYDLSLAGAGEDAGATGDLDVLDDLTITGPGPTAFEGSIDANAIDRVFDVQAGAELRLVLVRVEGGAAIADPRGGGVLNAGTLVLDRVWMDRNRANDGAGNGAGGGLYNLGTATVRESLVELNSVAPPSTSTGAGIHNAGMLAVINSTVALNNGIFNSGQASGAGIYNAASGTTALSNATIARNGNGIGSPGPAGGIFNAGGSVTLQNTAIGANFSSPPSDCAGTLTSGGYNVIQDATGCTVTGDLTGVQTGVGMGLAVASAFNGGPTPVYHLDGPSSSLVEAGNPALPGSGGGACEARDQGGYNRALGASRCDIGAEELSSCLARPIFEPCNHQGLSGKGRLAFKNDPEDAKDSLKWDFAWGPLTADSLFGGGSDDYKLCIWDDTGLIGEASIPGGGTCAGKLCWKDGANGLTYADKDATPHGITAVRFKAGKGAKVGLKGKGTDLRLAPPPWFGTVTVRLRNDDAVGPDVACWETTHSTPKKNALESYSAHGD